MKCRKNLTGPGFLLLSMCLFLPLTLGCSPARPHGPVIVLLLDTLRQDALGCYGNPRNPSPNIDRLARDGVRFEHAISASGWTLPAVGSLLTGTWPTIHGAMGKGVMLRPIRDEVPTAAEVLKQSDYRTVAIANAAFVSPMVGVHRGFDVFDHKYSYNDDARTAGEVIDLAIERLDGESDQPSFYFIHLFDPHLTYAPPAEFGAKYTDGRTSPLLPITAATCLAMQTGPQHNLPPTPDDQSYVRAAYLGEVDYMDAQLGRFIAALEQRGLYAPATIVVTSDHGEEFWEHGGFEHGHSLYDELLRVPLIIKPPASAEFETAVVDRSVRVLDVMPTLFEIIGVRQPATFEGRSLLPLMRGEADEERAILAESTLYGSERIAWRTERYKYIHDAASGPIGIGELYDWQRDPGETTNLAAQEPELAKELRQELFDYYFELRRRAKRMSNNEPVDLNPTRIRQLRSLGYIR